MTDTLVGVVVAHGAVAEALVGAAEEISGIRGALIPVSNAGLGREALEQRVAEAVAGRRTVLFVDLPSGSCLFAAMRGLSARENVRVVTGVNLVMLLDFLFHREGEIAAAARRAAEAGARAISER
jgi:mannose/fructose-specific phosphotransferase system component IIA